MAGLVKVKLAENRFRAVRQGPNGGNDYGHKYQFSDELPQSHITNVEDPFVGYPKLQELQARKKKHIRENASPPAGLPVDKDQLPNFIRSWSMSGARFDTVMIGGCTPEFDHEYLAELPLNSILAKPSLVFLWVPPYKLREARSVLLAWGCRRSEDITYCCRSESSPFMPPQKNGQAFKATTWHCLMGIKGTIRRSDDAHLIHCNLNTDVIIESENPVKGIVPQEIYTIIENLSLMMRRIHIVPYHCPQNMPFRARAGWVTIGPDTFLSNFNPMNYTQPILLPSTAGIDQLRPRTPPQTPRK